MQHAAKKIPTMGNIAIGKAVTKHGIEEVQNIDNVDVDDCRSIEAAPKHHTVAEVVDVKW